jgi:hypothetical protein
LLVGRQSSRAVLDFLGLGDLTILTWANMMNDGFTNMYRDPQLVLWPALAIAVTYIAFTLSALRGELERSTRPCVDDIQEAEFTVPPPYDGTHALCRAGRNRIPIAARTDREPGGPAAAFPGKHHGNRPRLDVRTLMTSAHPQQLPGKRRPCPGAGGRGGLALHPGKTCGVSKF